MAKKGFIPNKLLPWVEARNKFRLSNAQIQMARELGLNPKKLGKLANNHQETWKVPLPEYIEHLYEKSHGKILPDDTLSIEARLEKKRLKKIKSKKAKDTI